METCSPPKGGEGGLARSVSLMGLGNDFGQPSMKAILFYGVNMTLKYTWEYASKGRESGVDPHELSPDKVRVIGNKRIFIYDMMFPRE